MCQAGFDAVFFARADYQDVLQRRKDRTMETIWRGSKSLGSSSQVNFIQLPMKLYFFLHYYCLKLSYSPHLQTM
jgi:hypothetical protein